MSRRVLGRATATRSIYHTSMNPQAGPATQVNGCVAHRQRSHRQRLDRDCVDVERLRGDYIQSRVRHDIASNANANTAPELVKRVWHVLIGASR